MTVRPDSDRDRYSPQNEKVISCHQWKDMHFANSHKMNGLLAQLVQSTALTGQGSLVRVQYSPQKPPCNAAVFVFIFMTCHG